MYLLFLSQNKTVFLSVGFFFFFYYSKLLLSDVPFEDDTKTYIYFFTVFVAVHESVSYSNPHIIVVHKYCDINEGRGEQKCTPLNKLSIEFFVNSSFARTGKIVSLM